MPTKSGDPELLNLLVAYPYMTADMVRLLNDNQTEIRFLLDSGAFTAWKAGKSINVDDYCRFIESLPFKPWRYFTLDVIGDPAGSLSNYEIMLRRGFNPVPIFTRGEDVSVLEDYYKTSEVVGVGGLVLTKGNKGFVNGIMQKVGKRKVHWLGFTSLTYIKAWRPYMCDTSSWNVGRYNNLAIYLGGGRLSTNNRKADLLASRPRWLSTTASKYAVLESQLFSKCSKERNTAWVSLAAGSIVQKSIDVGRHCDTRLFIAVGDRKSVTLLQQKHTLLKGL